jgi:DNA-binding response OmpR family regulator
LTLISHPDRRAPEPLIAIDVRGTLEREGASVMHARTLKEALRFADYPALSAGVLDLRVGNDDADPICNALSRRDVPFIFFTGLPGLLAERWKTTPVVNKPAAPEQIVGALQFVLSPEAREIIVQSQRAGEDVERLARMEQVIAAGEERIVRMRIGIARLAKSGADTSAAEQVVATTLKLIEGLREHRDMSARFAEKLAR